MKPLNTAEAVILSMQLNTLFLSSKTGPNLAEYLQSTTKTACDLEFRIEGKMLETELRWSLCLARERSWVRAPENTDLGSHKKLYAIEFTELKLNTDRLKLSHVVLSC